MVGQPLTILMPERYKAAHQNGLERFQTTGETHIMSKTVELAGLRKDNHEFPLELSLNTWMTGEGAFFSGILHDISERKQAEKIMAEQDTLLRTLIDILPDYIYVKDTHQGHMINNIAHLRVWGPTKPNGNGGKQEFDSAARQLAAHYYAHEQEVIRTGQPLLNKEETVVDPQGRKHWLLTTTLPLRDERGEITALVGVSRDITEHKQAEEALIKQHNLLNTLIDNLPDYIYVKDTQSRFLLANEALRRRFGATTVEEIVGKMDFDFSPPELAQQYYADERTIFHSGQALIGHEEPIFDHVTGTKRWVLTTKVPFFDGHGQIAGLVGMSRDITERKQAEEEKAQLLKTVNQQREQLRALARQLAEVQEAERQQIARELHDQIGQSLSALGFNLNFIRTQIPYTSPKAGLIWGHLNDSLALVEQTTERIRNVLAELRPPMLDDYGLVDSLEWYANRLAGRVGLNITVQGESLNPRLAPQVENALFRIAQEALNNIAKHAQASQVTLTIEANSETVRVVITDDGVGFELAQTNGATKQSGWGLHIMAERAEMVGGRCWVASQPGQGTRVIAEAPRAGENMNYDHQHLLSRRSPNTP